MNKKLIKLGIPCLIACSYMNGQAQQINPMTEAVMRQYAEILAEDPKDYYTLYDRAAQYYSMGEYARALSDIEMALEYTPEKDSDYRMAEFALKSDILGAQKNYEGAIQCAKSALAINPIAEPTLYKLGNLYIAASKPQDALETFQQLQRQNPRSQEAFYGMARANVMLGNPMEAQSLLQQVESFGDNSFLTYCRLGDLYAEMGELPLATKNYLIAYNLEDNSSRALESLKVISKKNPQVVMESLDNVIAENPDNIALNYVEAILAFDGGDYVTAERACKAISKDSEHESSAVYRMMAMSQLFQNKLQEAVESIKIAEKMSPANKDILTNKSDILLSQNAAAAIEAADAALKLDADYEAALIAGARAAVLLHDADRALGYLNNVILSNPSNIEALLLRGYVNEDLKKDEKAASADYNRAGNAHQDGSVNNLVLGALGKAKAGKLLDADGMIKDAVKVAGNDKNDLYLIAVYYAQTGNLDKAREYSQKALLEGYSNLYNLQTNKQPLLNLIPMR